MEMILSQDCIDQFLYSLSANGQSDNTIRAYRADLMGLKDWTETYRILDPNQTVQDPVEFEHETLEYIKAHKDKWAPTTLKRKLASFRTFAKWRGYDWFLARYKKPVVPPGIAHPIQEGIEGVIAMIDASKKPIHKAAIVLTGLCGLRVGEALTIRPSAINEERMELKLVGKGNKTRVVPMADYAYERLLPRLLECWADDGLLVPLHERSARRAIKSAGKKAKLSRPIASHDMRMTFGTTAYYNSGGDIRAVQELLGHSSIDTTVNYTQASMDRMRAAAEIVKREDKPDA